MAATKWVYRFEEVNLAEEHVGGQWDGVRGLFGGKGANLAEMLRIGLPVPPASVSETRTTRCWSPVVQGPSFPCPA